MKLLAIDPGPAESAMVIWDGKRIWSAEIVENDILLKAIWGEEPLTIYDSGIGICRIEMISSYGMPVGADVFDTVVWIGRFYEAWQKKIGNGIALVYRHAVKNHHCNSHKAKDSNIRQVLIDKYGPPFTTEEYCPIGKKGQPLKPRKRRLPGLTSVLKEDTWQAFALATYYTETHGVTNSTEPT